MKLPEKFSLEFYGQELAKEITETLRSKGYEVRNEEENVTRGHYYHFVFDRQTVTLYRNFCKSEIGSLKSPCFTNELAVFITLQLPDR